MLLQVTPGAGYELVHPPKISAPSVCCAMRRTSRVNMCMWTLLNLLLRTWHICVGRSLCSPHSDGPELHAEFLVYADHFCTRYAPVCTRKLPELALLKFRDISDFGALPVLIVSPSSENLL